MVSQVLAFEAGRKRKIRVNTISAGIGGFSFLSFQLLHLSDGLLSVLTGPHLL